MGRLIWRGLVWVDKLANWTLGWVFGGGTHPWGLTLSDRFYLLREEGRWVGRLTCRLLDRFDPSHCETAIKEDHT